MNESVEVSVSKVGDPKKESPEQKKSFFQEIWGGFKEGLGKLWKKAGETLESVNKKAEEISEKISVESVSNYFKTQSENFRDGIQERSYDIYGAFYEIGAAVSQAKVFFWHNIMNNIMPDYARENRENVKNRKQTAKEYYLKAKEKAKENRERAKKRNESAKRIEEVIPKKEIKV